MLTLVLKLGLHNSMDLPRVSHILPPVTQGHFGQRAIVENSRLPDLPIHTSPVCVILQDRNGMRERERDMLYLTTHSTHFIHGYMASDIWLRTILIVRKETRCHHIGYSYRLTARVLLYAPSHRQDNTYHSLCYTSRGSLAAESNEWMFNDTSAQNINRLLSVRQMVC